MASIILLSICFGLIVYKVYKYMFFKPPNFPPGPPRIPIFGAYLFVLLLNYNHIHKGIDWLCKFYKTNILGIYLGPFLAVVANDSKSIKEVMLNRSFDGRPDLHLTQLRDPNNVTRGVFFTQGLYWRDQRRFTLRHLRDFGFGRRFSEVELDIGDELQQWIDMIKYGPKYSHEKEFLRNGLVECPKAFYSLLSNSFLRILCNERVPRENQDKLLKVAHHSYNFIKDASGYGRLLSIVPWIAKLFPDLTQLTDLKNSSIGQFDFMKELVDEQYKTYNENYIRHFLDLYFKEMKAQQRNKHFKNADFGYDQLIMTCIDFFLAASVLTSQAIGFYMRQMILDPQIKRKVQQEIDDVVGRSRLPTLDDRSKLHYTEASIREILRLETLTPSGIPHLTLEATQLSQYDIPQYCVIVTGLLSGHLDSSKWDDPNKFEPNRFLDENGKLDLKKDFSVPFGAGKRLCAGETHARNILFLAITAVLQNFDVLMPEKSPLPTDSITGLASIVPDFLIKFEPR